MEKMEVRKGLDVRREVLEISSEVIFHMGKFLREQGFIEILPVVISPITDPLNHTVLDASIDYYEGKYSLTKSMIFHKQLALRIHPKIFSFSPNVRLETRDKEKSGRHLIEFTQLDLEMKNATREDIMNLVEDMLVYTLTNIYEKFKDFIEKVNPHFSIPSTPFERIKFLQAREKYGEDFENILSQDATEPFWIIDIPIDEREFYDKLSEDGKTLLDMDLMYPYGFNEASSGGEREYEYDRIVKRMRYKGNDIESMKWYLEEVKKGIPPSAGCGIGIERLTRFICNLKHVKESRLFAKVPGELSI